jgi:hypothetical protein
MLIIEDTPLRLDVGHADENMGSYQSAACYFWNIEPQYQVLDQCD